MLTAIPTGKAQEVVAMLKAIHAEEDRVAAEKKTEDIVAKLHDMRLAKAAKIIEEALPQRQPAMAPGRHPILVV